MREASTKDVDKYIASVQNRLRTTLWEVQTQSMAELKDRCYEPEAW